MKKRWNRSTSTEDEERLEFEALERRLLLSADLQPAWIDPDAAQDADPTLPSAQFALLSESDRTDAPHAAAAYARHALVPRFGIMGRILT